MCTQGDVVGTYQQGSFSACHITTTLPKLILNFTKKTNIILHRKAGDAWKSFGRIKTCILLSV